MKSRFLLITALLGLVPMAFAVDSSADAELIRKLITRVDQLEHDLAEVKGEAAGASLDTAPVYPSVKFSGFADLTYHVYHGTGRPAHFELGELDFFVNSRISEKAGFIVETVLSADDTDHFGVDLERLIFQYRLSDSFNFDVGRFHTALGFYNTAYHHGTWFQTATGRPDFVNYEDAGGILPVHMVGVSLHGAVPSGSLGLSYFAEVGNNHQYRDPAGPNDWVANVTDSSSAKAVNLALISRPTALPGLQFGAGIYHDALKPDGQARTVENIPNVHLVYKNAFWEFIGEGYRITHAPTLGVSTRSTAWFAQVSRQLGSLRPYLRYTAVDIPANDAAYALIGRTGRHHTTSYGLRWDFADFAAYKVQWDEISNVDAPATSELTFQVAVTF